MTDHRPEPHVHDAAPVKNATEARQGSRGRPVLYVLIAGIVLVVLAFLFVPAGSDVDDSAPATGTQTESAPPPGGPADAPNAQ